MRTLLLAVILFTSALQAQEGNGDLKGKITNAQQQNLSNVTVRIHGLETSSPTNQTGEFSFENIDYGRYEIDVEISNSKHYNTTIEHNGVPISINIDNLTLDDLVVSANPLEHNQLKMTTPVAILSEEDLVLDRGLSIDQTLNKVTGVNSGSFGAGAGQVVIRGQQGPRVGILNNSVTVQDAASVSPDHWITTEPLLAKQIEILKGPATLLYGGGAVGGVVNVVDDVIPTQYVDGLSGGIEGRFSDSTLDERAGVFSINAGINEQFMAHVSYFNSSTDDFEIPGFAESEVFREAEETEHEEEEDEHGGEEEAFGLAENSSVDSDGYNVGVSRITDNGYWGVSYSDFSRNYGLPGHGHEEEGHHEDEEDHDEEEEEEGHDEEEEEIVRLDLEKSVFNIRGLHRFDGSNFFQQFKAHYTNTDYQHIEFEGDETGTVFDNQADEFRFELSHGTIGGFEGVWGMQFSNRDFSAIGEEAFILPSDTQVFSLFLIEERNFDNWHAEFGIRYDNQSVDTALFNDIDESALSISFGATFDLNDHWTLPINITSAQRLPTAEEYFSNQSGSDELVPHLATNVVEIGNPDLKEEVANNFDIGIKYRNNGLSFNAAFFYNQIDDYIFLRNTGAEVEEFPVFMYAQQNSTFMGYEADLGYQFDDAFNNQWNFRLFTDATEAELNTGENVPRIPSNRFGAEINWLRGPWSVGVQHTHVAKQNDLAAFELPTDGYDLLDLTASWVNYHDRFETLIFIRADNLLDEEVREHASFIKDLVPRPGRSVSAGFRLTF